MKANIKKRWIKALRSGKYKQAKMALKDNQGGMCCLGVLCDVTKRETGGHWKGNEFFDKKENANYNPNLLPDFVANILDMPSNGILKRRYYTTNGYQEALTSLNDNGLSFKQIANIIDKNF